MLKFKSELLVAGLTVPCLVSRCHFYAVFSAQVFDVYDPDFLREKADDHFEIFWHFVIINLNMEWTALYGLEIIFNRSFFTMDYRQSDFLSK